MIPRLTKSKSASVRRAGLAVLGVAFLASCQGIRSTEPKRVEPSFRVVQLYFLSENLNERPGVATAPPVRWVRVGKRFHHRVVKALLSGVTEGESRAGYYSSFFPSVEGGLPEPTDVVRKRPLLAYFNSITVADGVAIVDFDKSALAYLNTPAAFQFSVKEPIRRTLLQFNEIQTVKYSIEGVVFTEWKA